MMINISGPLPPDVSDTKIRTTIRETFHIARRVYRGEIAVRFATEKEISKLNLFNCGKEKPTDVLAFPAKTSEPKKKEWGDLFIATPYAKREAASRKIELSEEIIRLLSHGTLHLLGYDHRTKKEEKSMFGKQERVVARVMYGI